MERSALGSGERAIVKMLRAPYGDFRPWGEIDRWAEEIADALEELERASRSESATSA